MDRRNFLRGLVGGLAVTAAAPQWPFRVFSFPSTIKIAQAPFAFDEINAITLEHIRPTISDIFFADTPFLARLKRHQEDARLIRTVRNINEHPERWHWEVADDANLDF